MSYKAVQKLIDMGNGFAAKELGPPHDVYRVSNTSNGDIIQPANKIASGVKVRTKIAYGGGVREALETEKTQGIMWYSIIADMRKFLIGDIFVVNDPVYGQGSSSVNFANNEFKGFAFADHSPIKKALGARINTTVTIFRNSGGPNIDDQFDKTAGSGQPVVCVNGVFSLGAHGDAPCKIPAGLMAMRSYGDRQFDKSPGELRKSAWELYVPALNGFNVKENDRVIGPDGALYLVVIPYTQHVGASGGQWFLERQGGVSG